MTVIIVIILILLAIGVLPKLLKVAGEVLAAIIGLAILLAALWVLYKSYRAVFEYNILLCLSTVALLFPSGFVLWKIQPRDFYLGFFFKIYAVFLVIVGLSVAVHQETAAPMAEVLAWWSVPGLALTATSIVSAMVFPINRALFFQKFKAKKIAVQLSREKEGISYAKLLVKMQCPAKKSDFFLELLNELVKSKKVLAIRVNDEDDYLLHSNVFNNLVNEIEQYLLTNGSRDLYQIQESLTGDSPRGLFLLRALARLVKEKKVTEKDKGASIEKSGVASQYLYSHVERPMVSRELDLDEDEDEEDF